MAFTRIELAGRSRLQLAREGGVDRKTPRGGRMIDAHNILQPLTMDRIDLSEEQSVLGWSVRLAVGEAELREAVDAVGTCPSQVREYLGIR
jgi:hypothetical protein